MPTSLSKSTSESAKDKLLQLAEKRQADLIFTFVTSDKNPANLFSAQIALDVMDIFYKQLRKSGKKKKITLVLHSAGGNIEAPWPIVSLFREYCETFEVIVCRKALSAATLICLGADKIVMTPSSFLSPIDPHGVFKIGNQNKEIEIENISSFIKFAKERVGITQQEPLIEVLRSLVNEVPPTILGSVYRTHFMIRSLAEKMFGTHKKKIEEQQRTLIISNLTEKLYAHNHLISRKEARDIIGFKTLIEIPPDEQESLIEEIYQLYSDELEFEKKFNMDNFLLGLSVGQVKELDTKRAIIESQDTKSVFTSKFAISLNQQGAGPNIVVNEKEAGWLTA